MRMVYVLILILAGVIAAAVLLAGNDQEPIETSLSVAAALSADTTGYARAAGPREFVFPADHGPHPDFRTEWWYYTGNVASSEGRHFGYQFTLFRTALSATQEVSNGTWATRQLYMAHLALADAGAGEHVAEERFSRGAAGLAGAEADPFRVWLEDWEVEGLPGADSVRITADAGEFALHLVLARAKPIVFQGDKGFDRKGPELGNASYYFSMTRMSTTGTVTSGGATYDVIGLSWMDREWSTSALSNDQVGWDWFSLQLENGAEVMYYRLRQRDGSTSPYSGGTVVAPQGETHPIHAEDVHLDVVDTWTSRSSGIQYPAAWRLGIAEAETLLDIEPLFADQELELSIRYWEGAVRVSGIYDGRPVDGFGFVEMTGYGESDAPDEGGEVLP